MAGGDGETSAGGASEAPLASAATQRRKRRDAALALPLAGLFLLASPLLDVVARAGAVLGVPVAVLYVFGVWAGLILLTGLATRSLRGPGGDG